MTFQQNTIDSILPFLSRDSQGREGVQTLAVNFVKVLHHVPYEAALRGIWLFEQVHGGDPVYMHKTMHDLLDFHENQFLSPPALSFAVLF